MPDVCLIVPCYNEEQRLRSDELLAFLTAHAHVHFCLVDDGSADGTMRALERIRLRHPARVTVLSLATNAGKGEAVRQGVLHAAAGPFDFVGYWDADLSTPLTELDGLLAAFQTHPACQIALGSRVKRLGSRIDRLVLRHVQGRIFATCASQILRLPVYDSQCGSKLFRVEMARRLFAEPFITRWLFDLELIARLRNALGREEALKAAIEVPLTVWVDVAGSKLRLSDLVRVPFELWKIRAHYNRG